MVLVSSDYNKKWNNDHTSKEGIRDKLRKAALSQTPLKPRIEETQRKLQIQVSNLDGMSSKMQQKDRIIFSRIVCSRPSKYCDLPLKSRHLFQK